MKNISLHLLNILINLTNAGEMQITVASTSHKANDKMIFEGWSS